MELNQAILTRRSCRKFKDTPIDDSIIQEMLELARVAPSGGNGQTHVFGIIKDPKIKHALADAAGGQQWIEQAPIVIACCSLLDEDVHKLPSNDFSTVVNKLRWGEDFWDYLLAYPNWKEVACLMADAAPMIPTEHMVLCAVQHGLSSCFVGYLDIEKASNILGLPEDMKCLYLLPIGYAAEEPKPIRRKSIEEISFTDKMC